MKKMSLFIAVWLLTVLAFCGTGRCEESKQTSEAPKQISMMERIKKTYSNFRNRAQNQAVAGKKDAGTKAAAAKSTEAAVSQVKKAEVKTAGQSENIQPVIKKEGGEKLTREELLTDIKDDLEMEDEILNAMPAIKAGKDDAGRIFYTYNGVKLDDMNRDELEKLFHKVGQLAVKFRTERIQEQLETVRRATEVSRGGATVPKAPSVPKVPRASVPAVPKLPAAPPVPPSER